MVCVAIESPLQEDVRKLIAALDEEMQPLSPPQYRFNMAAEQLAGAYMTVFVARLDDGSPVGIGALKDHGGGLGEVKRMFTLPEVRGQRIGTLLLQRIERLACEKGVSHLVLETGEAPGFEPAWRIYERGGFRQCGAVLDYSDSGYSRFYEKNLSA